MTEKNTSSSSSSGPGCATLMFLIFMTLKLCGVIHWSWWWVTAPLWIGAGIGLLFLAGALIVAGIVVYMDNSK